MSRLRSRLDRVHRQLSARGLTPEEARALMRHWNDHGRAPDHASAEERRWVETWAATLAAMETTMR